MISTLISFFLFACSSARAEEMPSYELRLKNHKFSNEKLAVEANKKFKLKVVNEDASSEEFESNTMVIEKFIGPKKTINVILGPLKPGTYEFMGEFHQNTAKGHVIAQ